jgi:MscS family membrane protein
MTPEQIEALKPLLILLATLLLTRFAPTLLKAIFKTVDGWFESVTFRPSALAEMVAHLVPPLRFFITVLGIWLAFISLGIPPSSAETINDSFLSLLVIIFFWGITRVVELSFDSLQIRIKDGQLDPVLNETVAEFGSRVARMAVLLIGLSVVVQFWGYNVGGIITGLGLGGLAVAFAAQETLANMISYLSLISDRPYEVGDYVVTKEFEGTVEAIGFRSTRLRGPDRALIVVPNSQMAREVITNWTGSNIGIKRGRARLALVLRLDRQASISNVEAFRQTVHQLLGDYPRLVPDSAVVNLTGFGTGWLEFSVTALVTTIGWADFQEVRHDLYLAIYEQLGQHHLDLYEPK